MPSTRKQLYVIITLAEMAYVLVIFSCSRAMAEQNQGLLVMGLQGGLWALASSLTCMGSVRLSDRIGRKWVIAMGLILTLIGAGVCLLDFPNPATIFGGYFILGIGTGAFYAPIIAWLTQGKGADAAIKSTTRTLISFCVAWNVGIIFGQTAGGWLYDWVGGLWPITVAIGLLLLNVIWIMQLRQLPAPPTAAVNDSTDLALAQRTAQSASFARLCWVANLGWAFALGLFGFLIPDLMTILNIDADIHGTVLAASRVVALSTFLLMHLCHFWHYRFSIALLSQCLGFAGLIILINANSLAMLVLGIVGLEILMGYGYFASIYYSTTGSCDKTKGAALGIHEATVTAGIALGPACGGIIGSIRGPRSPYILAACVIAATSIWQIVIYYKRIAGKTNTNP